MTIDKSSTLLEIETEVLEATLKLQRAGLKTLHHDLAVVCVRHLFTDRSDPAAWHSRSDRGRKGARLKAQATTLYPAEADKFQTLYPDVRVSNTPRYVARLLRWHVGNGDLHGLFGVRWEAGEDFADRCDSLAQAILVLSGAKFNALNSWKATGLL